MPPGEAPPSEIPQTTEPGDARLKAIPIIGRRRPIRASTPPAVASPSRTRRDAEGYGPEPVRSRHSRFPGMREDVAQTRTRGLPPDGHGALRRRVAGRLEQAAQLFADLFAGVQVPAIDDGETKAAGRHGMVLRRHRLVEGDLDRRDPWPAEQLGDRGAIDGPAPVMIAEQHDAVALATDIGELPELPRHRA